MSAADDLHSAAYFADPYPAYEQMRRDDPVCFDPPTPCGCSPGTRTCARYRAAGSLLSPASIICLPGPARR